MKVRCGIDVGGTTIKIGLFDEKMNLVEKYAIETKQNIFKDVADSLKGKDYEIIGYGVGVPGPVVDNVVDCPNANLKNVNVKEELKKYVHSDNIFVGNDANMAALVEANCGAGVGLKSCATITIGTGIGCGIVVDGKILNGDFGAGGEIGHIKVTDEGECGCGNIGCLETTCAAKGIHRIASKSQKLKDLSVKEIVDLAREGDEEAFALVDSVCYYLAYAASIMACVVNPSAIIFGGGISNGGAIIIDNIKKHFDKIAFRNVKNTKILKATAGNDAGIIGAAYLTLS